MLPEISLRGSTVYYYTRLFKSLEDVLQHGLDSHVHSVEQARARDAELAQTGGLNSDQRWLIAQATHSYFGSTQLLWDMEHEKPLWVVNEGEYLMINTFDLTVDHLFFELQWHPWAVQNTLDLFVDRYAFHEHLNVPNGLNSKGGISFTHQTALPDKSLLQRL